MSKKYTGFAPDNERTFLKNYFSTRFITWMKNNDITATTFIQYNEEEVLEYFSELNGFSPSFKMQVKNYYGNV